MAERLGNFDSDCELEIFNKQIGVSEHLVPWFENGAIQNERVELRGIELRVFE